MALGEALGNVVGGILGNNAAKADRKNAKAAMKQAAAVYDQIGLPPDVSKELILKEFRQIGILTPELEEDLNQTIPESQFDKIKPNEALSREQLASVGGLKLLSKTGIGAEDRAALNEMRSRLRQDEQASTQALLQKLQSQGMGGSGAALMASLGNSQQAANLASREADALAANQSTARRQALTELGRAAGEMQNQQFNRESQIATAMDERNRFLAENSIARQTSNVQSLNAAQLRNLQEQQRVSDANIQQANDEKQRQANAQFNQYGQKLQWAGGKSGQLSGLGNFYTKTADSKAQAQKDIGAGIGGLGDAAMAKFSDEELKENIDESGNEVQKFMDRISKKFRT
jgi:hypothetical protein